MRCIFFQIFRILVCSLFFITKVFAGEFHPMSSISLDGVDKGGHVIHAPSYCLAQNYNDVCAMGATFLNQHGFEQSYFYDSSSQNYKIYSESLQLFGTIGNGYTVDNLSAPSQTADYLMIVHLGDTPLNKHCGVVQSSDTRGCTYDEVNTLWSNLGEQIDEASAMAKYRRGYLTHSVSKGHVSINYYLDINYNLSNMALFLGTSKTVNQLGIKFNLNIEEAYTPTRFIRGYDSEDFSLNGINYTVSHKFVYAARGAQCTQTA